MKILNLEFSAELLKALEGAAAAEGTTLAEWIQTPIISQIAREPAYKTEPRRGQLTGAAWVLIVRKYHENFIIIEFRFQ